MAVPQSCFEASVNALPWINVVWNISGGRCAIATATAGSQKTAQSLTLLHLGKGRSFIYLTLFFQPICKVTHQQSNKYKTNMDKRFYLNYLSQKHKHSLDPFPTSCSPLKIKDVCASKSGHFVISDISFSQIMIVNVS